MGKIFNLKKIAEKKVAVISEKSLEKNREAFDLTNEEQKVVDKNINLSIPKKEKDNTIPFNQQLEASRQNKENQMIIESKMNDKIINFGDKDKIQITDINKKSQEYDTEKEKQYKEAEMEKEADTAFWDKFVGVQLEEKMKKVDNNIPSEASQLQNNPDRFKKEDIEKMVMASVKDADAMLFHIYANAYNQDRDLTKEEEQKVSDINSGKIRIINSFINRIPIIKAENGSVNVYEATGELIDSFDDITEAMINYPEGEIVNG